MKQKELYQQSLRIPIPQHFLKQVQNEKQQLFRIRQQQQTITSIGDNIRSKNQQITNLKSLVERYEPYYRKYNELSKQYMDKCGRLSQKEKQYNLLIDQVNQLISQNRALQSKYQLCLLERNQLVKEQLEIQKVNKQIQQTFNLYQEQCKKKEATLLKDLQKAYKQVTELNKRIDEYEMKVFQNQELKRRLTSSQQQHIANSTSNVATNSLLIDKMNQQLSQLKFQFSAKQEEVLKYKILNRELSIQFDKSVSKICEFEKELSRYRQQNHELQKMLNLFIEKEKYEKMHLKELQKVKGENYMQEKGNTRNYE